jgi:hypothetical protein
MLDEDANSTRQRRRLLLISELLISHGAQPTVPPDKIVDLDEKTAQEIADADGHRLATLAEAEAELGHRASPPPHRRRPQ